ncbi:MAG: formylglycine-generating enzyme family protein, partial [Fuerstiella sp.]
MKTPPTDHEIKQFEDALMAARQAVANRELDLADATLTDATPLAKLAEQKERLEQARLFVYLNREFRETLRLAMSKLEPAKPLKAGNSTVLVVETLEDGRVTFRIEGKNGTFAIDELPIGLALAVSGSTSNPQSQLIRAAFVYGHAGANDKMRAEARKWIEDAAQTMPDEAEDLLSAVGDNNELPPFAAVKPKPIKRPEALTARRKIPDEAAISNAQKSVDSIYQKRFTDSMKLEGQEKFTALKILAEEIYSLHRDEADEDTKYVLLQSAVRWATASGDPNITMRIIEDFASQYEVDALEMRASAFKTWSDQIERLYRGDELRSTRKSLLEMIQPVADLAESEYRFKEAADLYTLAAAQLYRTTEQHQDLKRKEKTARDKAQRHKAMLELADSLDSDSEPAKHLELGIYWCFDMEDWDEGLPHLVASKAQPISSVAALDVECSASLLNTETVGDRWWNLALVSSQSNHKTAIQARAAYWYVAAIRQNDTKGLARKRLEKRISDAGLSGTVFGANSIGMQFKLLPGGTFTMGDGNIPVRGNDVHQVTLTKPFGLGVYEVTQEQYEQVMGSNPSEFKGPQNPVERSSWDEAVEFCRKLSELPAEKAAGYVYRLPTEAEWEYACRAGTTTKYSFGDSQS